jgi:hypothetical protein
MVIHGPNSDGFQVDDALVRLIEDLARRNGETPSEFLRHAVEHFEHAAAVAAKDPTATPFQLAEQAGVIGSVQGAPPDLSTNPDHFEGFGRD